jgi:hypothetical protein
MADLTVVAATSSAMSPIQWLSTTGASPHGVAADPGSDLNGVSDSNEDIASIVDVRVVVNTGLNEPDDVPERLTVLAPGSLGIGEW